MKILTDLITGWSTTLRKWSVQINVANGIWSGGALLAYQFGYLPLWFVPVAFWVAIALLIASTIASNLPQKDIITLRTDNGTDTTA